MIPNSLILLSLKFSFHGQFSHIHPKNKQASPLGGDGLGGAYLRRKQYSIGTSPLITASLGKELVADSKDTMY